MKKIIMTLIFLVGSSIPASATVIDFTGYYDVSNWTSTLTGDGSIDTSGAPGSISMTSNDDGGGSTNQDFTIDAQKDAPVSFYWYFETTDVDGSGFDPFGFLLNGDFTQLTNSGGDDIQSGYASFDVLAGDIFGFRAHASDSAFGAATTTINEFMVPEPANLALLGFGLLGFAALRRRKAAA